MQPGVLPGDSPRGLSRCSQACPSGDRPGLRVVRPEIVRARLSRCNHACPSGDSPGCLSRCKPACCPEIGGRQAAGNAPGSAPPPHQPTGVVPGDRKERARGSQGAPREPTGNVPSTHWERAWGPQGPTWLHGDSPEIARGARERASGPGAHREPSTCPQGGVLGGHKERDGGPEGPSVPGAQRERAQRPRAQGAYQNPRGGARNNIRRTCQECTGSVP